jgi:hypothetical protein
MTPHPFCPAFSPRSSASAVAWALALVWPLLASAQATPSAPELAGWQRASACVAVLKADVEGLRERAKAGTQGLRPEMVEITGLGFAFVGDSYKQGLRNPLADRLLNEAEAAQKTAPAESLRALSQACRAEGALLLQQANGLERMLVKNRAEARVDRLLAR